MREVKRYAIKCDLCGLEHHIPIEHDRDILPKGWKRVSVPYPEKPSEFRDLDSCPYCNRTKPPVVSIKEEPESKAEQVASKLYDAFMARGMIGGHP